MSGVLLLVTKTAGTIPVDMGACAFALAGTLVFIQNGVYNTEESLEKSGFKIPDGAQCYALGEDIEARKTDSPFEKIDYPWLVDAIEACEKTITL
jgi:sulfur transfer complex TusBCD TusB component (DsrH family)